MNTSWLVETHGDPLGILQNSIKAIWEQLDLDAFMFAANGSSKPRLFTEWQQVGEINPFKPLMTQNTAKHVPEAIENFPDGRIGVLLKPCEMRALIKKGEKENIPLNRLLTICADCLGTYPLEDYQWRADRKGNPERLAWESLHFARQGGIASYRFRSACQSCRTPVAQEANLNFGVIGLPVRLKFLVQSQDPQVIDRLGGALPLSENDQTLMEQRDIIISKILQRGSQTRQRLGDSLESILPKDLEALMLQFEQCGECRECFNNCPLCTADYPAKDEHGSYLREDVKEWMVSCAGCGMCEQACPNHLPLVTIFSMIREQLIQSIQPTC